MGLYFLLLTGVGRTGCRVSLQCPQTKQGVCFRLNKCFYIIFQQKLSDCVKQSLCPASYCTMAGLQQITTHRSVDNTSEIHIFILFINFLFIELVYKICYNFSVILIKPCPEISLFKKRKKSLFLLLSFQSYLDYFSRALHYEYASKGIFVQSLVPSITATKMVAFSSTVSKRSIIFPTAEEYASHAVSTLGLSIRTTGYWKHAIQVMEFTKLFHVCQQK